MNNPFLEAKSSTRISRIAPFLCAKYPTFRPIWERTLEMAGGRTHGVMTIASLVSELHPEAPQEQVYKRTREIREELTKLMEHPTRWTEVSPELVLKLCVFID